MRTVVTPSPAPVLTDNPIGPIPTIIYDVNRMLGQCRRQWENTKPMLGYCRPIVFLGNVFS